MWAQCVAIVALLIAAGTRLFGHTAMGVRAGPAMAALLMHVAAVVCAWQLAGRGPTGLRAATRAAMLVALLPIATLGLVLATPDALLFASAMFALLGVERALAAPLRSWRSLGWWTVAQFAAQMLVLMLSPSSYRRRQRPVLYRQLLVSTVPLLPGFVVRGEQLLPTVIGQPPVGSLAAARTAAGL